MPDRDPDDGITATHAAATPLQTPPLGAATARTVSAAPWLWYRRQCPHWCAPPPPAGGTAAGESNNPRS